MTLEKSEIICEKIAQDIANNSTCIDLNNSFESKDSILKRYLKEIFVFHIFDEELFNLFLDNFKILKAREFYHNKYIQNVNFESAKIGNFILTYSKYEKGEIFQREMPNFTSSPLFLKLSCFDDEVYFPTIYENNIPWMSVCPSEISSIDIHIPKAHGRVLVLGLGLGYYPYMISLREEVKEITIIEINPTIIQLFNKNILPFFEEKKKINVIEGDAIEYLKNVKIGDYDYCFADIWINQFDGSPLYLKIKENEERLKPMEFSYWIEDEIKEYLKVAKNKDE